MKWIEIGTRTSGIFLAVAAAVSLGACEVKKTEEGRAPSVDVDADAGKVPEYDVDTADVSVGKKEVTIPDTITVPDVDVTMPSEQADTTPAPATSVDAPAATPTPEEP